jgi:hypothetical protein
MLPKGFHILTCRLCMPTMCAYVELAHVDTKGRAGADLAS